MALRRPYQEMEVKATPMQIVSGTLKFCKKRVFRVILIILDYEIS